MNILTGDHFLMVSCRKVALVLHTFFWQQYSQLLLNVSLVILPICLTSGAWSWICGSPRHDEFLHTKITMIHLWEKCWLEIEIVQPNLSAEKNSNIVRSILCDCIRKESWIYKKKVVFDRWNWLSLSVNWPWQLQSAQTLLPVFLTNSKTRLPLMSAISPNTRTKQIACDYARAQGVYSKEKNTKLFGNHRKQPNRVPVWCVVITVVRTTIAASSTTTEISIFGGNCGGGLWFLSLLPIV